MREERGCCSPLTTWHQATWAPTSQRRASPGLSRTCLKQGTRLGHLLIPGLAPPHPRPRPHDSGILVTRGRWRWELEQGSQPGGTLRSLARWALSCTARPCSSGGRRIPVMAFSCRSKSLATLSKPASSCRPCRSEASAGRKSGLGVSWGHESQGRGRGGQLGRPGLAQPPLPLPGLTHAVPSAAQTVGPLPPPRPPTGWAVALAPTSRVLCLEHLMPLLECIPGPDCLLPHAPVLAAQAVRANMDWIQGSLLPLHPQAQDPGLRLAQQPRGVRRHQNALKS